MATDIMKERFIEIEKLARGAGLDPYDVHFFEVPTSAIYEYAGYGLPTRYSHWSFGRIYQHQKMQGEMGFSKIYEMVINSDPSYAFLDNSTPDAINLLVCAHVIAHSDFFKNNIMFRRCGETNMIQVAKRHAEVIDQFRKDFGDDEVDGWLDIALALERHIDVYKGFRRTRYAKRNIRYEDRPSTRWSDIVDRYAEPALKKIHEGLHIPPRPEKDILWFLSEYANLESWQKRIFEIVRRESYYFFPQHRTKIMNEGWASYWHAELMRQYTYGNDNDYGVTGIGHPLTAAEHLDFVAAHEKVVQPGLKIKLKVEVPEYDQNGNPTGRKQIVANPAIQQRPELFGLATRLNPYYLGFKIFRDIKKRWDKYYEQGYMINELDEEIEVSINGNQKIREVMKEEDDVSFLRNYLTEDLCDELHLFSYGNIPEYRDDFGFQEEMYGKQHSEGVFDDLHAEDQVVKNRTIVVKSKEATKIINMFAKNHNNYGAPLLVIRRIDESGLMRLEHLPEDTVNLDMTYANNVLKYIGKAWGRPVELIRKEKERTWIMKYDITTGQNSDVTVDYEKTDYPECVEMTNIPSSW